MPVTDAVAYVHGTGTNAFAPISLSGTTYGDAICAAGSQYSNLELDFGAVLSGSAYPYLTQLPSFTEKGYTFAPEVIDNSIPWGLHIRILSAFNTLTSINFEVCTSTATAALVGSSPNPIAARTLTLAQMSGAAVGLTYFIPVTWNAVLEFLRFYAAITGSNPTTGTIVAWFGPKEGGVV